MSRYRLESRLRRNADFQAVTRYLDDAGLEWRVVKRNAKGHPHLRVEDQLGTVAWLMIASTPMGGCNTASRVAGARRILIAAGIAAPLPKNAKEGGGK